MYTPPKVGKIVPSNEVANFGWFNVIYRLSDGKFLNRKAVLVEPIDETLSWLVYESARSFDEATTHIKSNK